MLSEEQILQLAPDEASRKAGIGLSSPGKWVSRGMHGHALWGECQGSGSKPYQTQVDLANIAFKCSCPSRKFPCKHGLGLLLFYARQPAAWQPAAMPPWVQEWMEKRSAVEKEKAPPKEKTGDPARLKRQEGRDKKVREGIEELLLWVKDCIRQGLMNLPDKKETYWEQMARRMVDAQAPGLAAMVRELGILPYFREGWQEECLQLLLQLYLVAQGYRHLPSLPDLLQEELRTRIGYTRAQEEMQLLDGVRDTWLVLAKQVTEEEQIKTERYWLYGLQTGKSALIMQFLVRGQGGTLSLPPGLYLDAELVFFPSPVPLRAHLKTQYPAAAHLPVRPHPGWESLLEEEAEQYATWPLRQVRPLVVASLRPVYFQQKWWLQDKENLLMEIDPQFALLWKLLALSGGQSIDMALVSRENRYEPVGIWQNGQYKNL